MNARATTAALAILAAIASHSPSRAAIVTMNFSGTVLGGIVDGFLNSSGVVAPGTIFSGSFSYDSAASPLFASPNNGGILAQYGGFGLPLSVSMGPISINRSYGFTGGNDIYNDVNGFGDAAIFRNIEADYTVYLQFRDPTGSAFSDTSLPTSLSYNPANLFYIRDNATGNYAIGRPTFVNSAVPEPASWAMMLAGLALVGSMMRRRRNVRVAFA